MNGTDEAAPKKAGPRGGRPRGLRTEVWLTPDEKAEIANLAALHAMSVSGYLRACGLHQPIRSMVDAEAVDTLLKINGDLGRVAGLLKLWLSVKPGQGASPADVEIMMKDFRKLQSELRNEISRVVHDR